MATTGQEYQASIDGFAAGIGDEEVVVILEPDGLGLRPATMTGLALFDIPLHQSSRSCPRGTVADHISRSLEASRFITAGLARRML